MGHFSRLFRIRHARFVRTLFFNSFCADASHTGHKGQTDIPLDRVDLRSLQLYGFHGCARKEKQYGQKFIVDAALFLCLQRAGLTDNLKHTVNYASVLRDLENVMKESSVNLIEHLAEIMCYRILEGYPLVQKVQISIKKPESPLPCSTDSFDYVGVTLFRGREDFKFVKRQQVDDEFDD